MEGSRFHPVTCHLSEETQQIVRNALIALQPVTSVCVEFHREYNFVIPMEPETIQRLNELKRDGTNKSVALTLSLSQLSASRSIKSEQGHQEVPTPTVDELLCLSLPELSQWQKNINTALMRRIGLVGNDTTSVVYPCSIDYSKKLHCYACGGATDNSNTVLDLEGGLHYIRSDCSCGVGKVRLTNVSFEIEVGLITFI